MRFLYILFSFILILTSCEDVIEINPEWDGEKLVVDAWLDNLSRPQTVRLTYSQPYFENEFSEAVVDASVSLIKNERETYNFVPDGSGNFTWSPGEEEYLGDVGDQFQLVIEFDNQTFTASTQIYRVPEIDSIAQVYEESQLGVPEGDYAELVADDFPGTGDSYWARTWKNGELLNKPFEMLLIFDATFDPGSSLDGITFIFPIRRGINPIPDEVEGDEEVPPPYVPGDSIYVELSSISNEGFRFLQIALEQMTNGNNGLFAVPIANTNSNIVSNDGVQPLGFFNVAAIETASKVIR